MITLLYQYSKKIFDFGLGSKKETNTLDNESLDDLAAQLDEFKEAAIHNEEPQLNLLVNEEGCFYKTGVVTNVTSQYVVIEHKYMCEMNFIIPSDLKVGDKVYYMAYKTDKNEECKIRKIEYKIEDTVWEKEETSSNIEDDQKKHTTESSSNINETDLILERREIDERVVVGKVDKRRGRDVFLDDGTCVNLDNVSSDFVPMVGDWVKLKSLVEVNETVPNLQGEILEVKEIMPLRSYKKVGKITNYEEMREFGVIDKIITFSKEVCSPGYIPHIGDQVVVQSIESDQGMLQNWRALTVAPMVLEIDNRFEMSSIKNKPQISEEELKEMVKDKKNLDITNNICVTLDAKAETEIEVTIKNYGNIDQTLLKCSFLTKKSQSQLELLSPILQQPLILNPSKEVIYKLKCKGKAVGVSEELIIFKFKNFKIGRIVRIKVNSINPTKQNSNGIVFTPYNNDKKSIMPEVYEEGMYIKGVKPYKPAKFIPNKPVTVRIPDLIWKTVNTIYEEKKTRSEAEYFAAEKLSVLQQHLTMQNYRKRFDYLLHLEEIAQILEMQKFDMSSAVMHRSGEYLILNVPGLAENRPSLISGDKVIVSFKWDETNGKKKYEGFIHKIRSSDVFLKFHETFQNSYHGEDCQISFKGSTTVINRCHTAISIVINSLGQDFLFPRKVEQKEPQYNFVEDEIDEEGYNFGIPQMIGMNENANRIKAIEASIYKRKLTWFNKKLNIYQKEAVRNILKGLARPLPYIIFGPPGTGKTVTVCETILQIFFTLPESRILIATPSNSSANLITERLLDNKLIKPGDLVRLVAHHYLDSENIPEKIIPYCVTADIAAEGSRADVNILNPRGYRTNVTLSVICRHRLIVGTCTALGILYNMGCKPGHFTHVIIDEAGQATEPEIMIPLSLIRSSGTQVVLAGDPKQLGPVNLSRLAGYFGLNDSFLVRLLQQFPYQRDPQGFQTGYDPRLITKLLMNYRSLPDLLELPNKLFYEAELIPQVDSENSQEAILLENLSDMLPKRLGAPPAVIFHDVNGKNVQDPDSPSWYNPEEATQVYIYLLDLYNHGLTVDDIGIITPYSKQVYRIKNLLAELEVDIPKVGSVEEFQGQERKVIILSVVRTAEDKVKDDIKHALGFVGAKERLNVAITRSRALLIIIGSSKLLEQDLIWRSVIDHCRSRGSFIGHRLRTF